MPRGLVFDRMDCPDTLYYSQQEAPSSVVDCVEMSVRLLQATECTDEKADDHDSQRAQLCGGPNEKSGMAQCLG